MTLLDTPAFRHSAYDAMDARISLVRIVYNGTEDFRTNYKDLLWQSAAETGLELEARSKRVEVFPALKQTVDGLTGVVFRVEPLLGDDVPEVIKSHCENIDGQGNHLTVFLKELFRDGLRDGHQGVLIDVAPAPVDEEGQPKRLSAGQETRQGIRPYWIQIFPDNILSFRVAVRNGVVILSQLVVKETSEEPDGLFSTSDVTRYRKYKIEADGRVSFRVWTQDMVDNWNDKSYNDPESKGFITNQTEIPFVAIYCGPKLAPLVTRPPLLDLAYANISHTNVVSDRRNGLHAAMHPILVFKGRRISPKDVNTAAGQGQDDSQLIGPGVGIDLPATAEADVFYAEHNGTALNTGRDEIQDIEKRMAAQGLAMLQNDTRAAETAEAKRIDKDEKTANLSSAARSLQDGAELCLAFHANYMRLPSGGSLIVNRQFEVQPLDPAMVTALSNAVGNGQLSLETLWEIMKKNEILPEDFDAEDELAKIVAGGLVPGIGAPPPEPKALPAGGGAKGETGPGAKPVKP
jgi:hypothetical protein